MGEEKCRQEIALLPLAELVYSRIAGWTFEPAIPTHIVVVAVAVFFTEKLRNPALGQFYLSRSGGRYRCPLMAKMEKKALSSPDEKRSFDKGQVELVTLVGVTFGRATLQPGWNWSSCVKPIAGTESCQAPHLQYHVSGRLRVRMDDGSEDEFGPGEVSLLAQGHDAWVVGMNP